MRAAQRKGREREAELRRRLGAAEDACRRAQADARAARSLCTGSASAIEALARQRAAVAATAAAQIARVLPPRFSLRRCSCSAAAAQEHMRTQIPTRERSNTR